MTRVGILTIAAACAALAACGGGKEKAENDDVGAAPASPPASAPAAQSPGPAASADAEATTLSASDEKLATGQFYDAYPLSVQAGKGTIITVNSRGFRPVIVVLDSAREKVSETEALSSNRDGSWTVEMSDDLPAGDYFVIVAASDVGATGPYTIEAASSTPIG